MINDRNESAATGIKWSPSSTQICVIYIDGKVIGRSVDDTKSWRRDFNIPLSLVEWSPDEAHLLFAANDSSSQIKLLDSTGQQQQMRNISISAHSRDDDGQIVAVDWRDERRGRLDSYRPNVAIALANGTIHFRYGIEENCAQPVIIESEIEISTCKWNPSGSILAVAGKLLTRDKGETKNAARAKFYTCQGKCIETLCLTGETGYIPALSWNATGRQIVLALGCSIVVADIKNDYLNQWAVIGDSTMMYACNVSPCTKICR